MISSKKKKLYNDTLNQHLEVVTIEQTQKEFSDFLSRHSLSQIEEEKSDEDGNE